MTALNVWNRLNYLQKLLIVGLFWLLLTTFISSTKVSAVDGQMSNVIPNNGSAQPWLVVTRPGSNGMDANDQTVSALVPASSGTFTMSIESACDTSPSYDEGNTVGNDTYFAFFYASNLAVTSGNGFVVQVSADLWVAQCTSGSDMTVSVTVAPTAPAEIINSISYRQVNVQASITQPASPLFYVNRFRYITNAGNYFSYAISQNPTVPREYTGIAYGPGSNGWGWSTKIAYAQKCGDGVYTGSVKFWDTDHTGGSAGSPYWQDPAHPMSYNIRAYNRTTLVDQGIVDSGTFTGGNNVPDQTSAIAYHSANFYVIEITNINYVNSIQVALPLWQFTASDTCSVPGPTPSCAINSVTDVGGGSVQPGERIVFTVTVANASGMVLGVNGPAYVPQGTYGNYLATGSNYLRTPIPPNGQQLVSKYALNDDSGTSYPFDFYAPGANGTYQFNWGLKTVVPSAWVTSCSYNLTVGTDVTISGRLMDAANISTGIQGIRIDTCVNAYKPPNAWLTTGINGWFSFTIPSGTGFCIRAVDLPAGATATGVRPWGEGYWTCPAYSGVTASPNYCLTQQTYEWQMAGGAYIQSGIGNGVPANIDRGLDTGYDIAYVFPAPTAPIVDCGAVSYTGDEFGTRGTLNATFINNTPASGRQYITITSASYSAPGATLLDVAGVDNTVPARQGGRAVVSQDATFPAPGTYGFTATINYIDGINPPGTKSCPGTANVYAKPYLKSFGADVSAGGMFDPKDENIQCETSDKSIYAFATGSGTDYRGASAQFGVHALLNINQFYSGSQRTSLNRPPKGTTFANTDAGQTYGGNFVGGGTCITNYYEDTQYDPPIMKPGNFPAAGPAANLGITQYKLPANRTISPAATPLTMPVGTQAAVFIDGDVFIERNIQFATAGVTNRSKMPNFALIVRGNIYIGSAVTRLDGLYVAQPSDPVTPTNGKIYTCSAAVGVLFTDSAIKDACASQLVVNGAFVAQQVKFYRTLNSLKDSVVREIPSSFGNAAGTNAAEVISFTPEMYLAPSALRDPASIFGGRYDSVFSLPPVL